jgi:hypothetical protein
VSGNPNRKSKRAENPIPLDRFGNPFPPRKLQEPKVLTNQEKFLIALPIILKMGWKLLLIPALFFGFPIVVVVAFLVGEFFVSTRRQY